MNPLIDDLNHPNPLSDCRGMQSHSLTMINGKEGIYPILLDLLNYIQKKTQKRVIITCGHRCPQHNTYSDPSKANSVSKHQIGAEVDFFVHSMEDHADKIIDMLFTFYKEHPGYRGKGEYEKFLRYENSDLNVSTPPWYNKEIFIKYYKPQEGRDLDNRHPYPYIGVQVRYDRDRKERVFYSWDRATHGYMRE